MTFGQHKFVGATQWLTAAVLLCCAAGAGAQAAATKQSVASAPQVQAPAPPKMPSVAGTEVDRVVAIVNNDLILDSDVDEERRFEAFQPYRRAETEYNREKAVERLVNRDLILQQAKLQGGEEEITDADVEREIADLRKNIPACARYQCQTKAGWDHFLADQGFTEKTFDARWKQRMQVLEFIEDRFRQGIRISEGDIKNYYDNTMLPEYKRQGAQAPPLTAVSVRIQEVLLEKQVSNLLSDWLKSLRAQGQVVVMHPGETAP